MRPVTIAVAITGSLPRKRDNPALPVLPAEQIESTHAAYEAGAALVHISLDRFDQFSHDCVREPGGVGARSGIENEAVRDRAGD